MKEQLFNKILSIINIDSQKKYAILDFGCGRGNLLNEIVKINLKSEIIGIDSNAKSIEYAKSNFKNIDFRYYKFDDHFEFVNGYFDLVISVDTLECVVNKDILLNEMHRILKPSGKILFAHRDWDTQVYNSKNKVLIRKLVHEFADWKQDWMDVCDGMMGRKLWGYFQKSNKFRGKIDVFNLLETKFSEGNYGFERLKDLYGLVTKGIIDKNDLDSIIDEMKILYSENQYFYSINSYIYYGEKV